MSVEVSTWAWKQEVSPNRKLVLLALADHCDNEGECWISIERIIEKTGISRATVYRSIGELKRADLLSESGQRWILRVRQEISQRDGQSQSETPYIEKPSIEPSKEPASRSSSSSTPTQLRAVWDHYATVMNKRREMNAEDRNIIRAALKVATIEDCKLAIDGCAASDFHMKRGNYEGRSGPKYDKLSQILRGKRGGKTTREQIEMLAEIAKEAASDPVPEEPVSDDPHGLKRGGRVRIQ